MIGQTISHYEITEKLGEGGMGVVYKARDHKLARDVALKFLPSKVLSRNEDRTRFIREARAAAGITHANVCAIHAIETAGDHTFIVMEYIAGEGLDERIASSPLPVETALRFVQQIARGLSRAHDKGIVHRDIKPANVRITPQGEVKVVDFGLARVLDQSRLTQSGTSVGTIAYMSPEQALGEELDARTDIFSLGVVLYEMLTGRLPFKGDVDAALLYGIVNIDPVALSESGTDFPPAVQAIIDRMLAKDPDARYASADEVASDIDRVLRGDTPELRVTPRRPWMRWTTAAVVGIAVVAAAVRFLPLRLPVPEGGNVVAAENRIAIMPFTNVVDPSDASRLGEVASTLLTSGLSQSEVLGVVSSQRIQDLLAQQTSGGDAQPTATDIASAAGARWMIEGDILQTDPYLVIATQTVDVASAEVTASHRVTGVPEETVFALVDRLIRDIVRDPSLPAAAAREEYHLVTDVTTQSTDAYRKYLEGIDHIANFRDADAKAALEAAVTDDSTFAMAYLVLSRSRIATAPERNRALQAAARHADHLNVKERSYVESRILLNNGDVADAIKKLESIIQVYPDEKHAHYTLGGIYMRSAADLVKAIEHLDRATELDPRNRLYWNELAYAHLWNGDHDGAIAAINESIALAPDEFAGYDTRGDMYALDGNLERAIDSYRHALELNPDSWETVPKLGYALLFAQKYDAARATFERNLGVEFGEVAFSARAWLARIPLFQGRLNDGLRELTAVIDDNDAVGTIGDAHVFALWTRSTVHAKLGDLDRAIEDVEDIIEHMARLYPGNPAEYLDVYLQYLCRAGRHARADSIAGHVESLIQDGDKKSEIFLNMAIGLCNFERENYDEACRHLESTEGPGFYGRFPLGLAYLKAGRYGNATRTLEAASQDYTFYRALDSVAAIEVVYYLGRAYEASGWREEAITEYQRFLDIWKDADPGIDTIDDARRRLTRLTAGG